MTPEQNEQVEEKTTTTTTTTEEKKQPVFVDPDTQEKFLFPENTPIKDMDDAQKAEYWRHKARKHESRNRELAEQINRKPEPPKQQGEAPDWDKERATLRAEAEREARAKYGAAAVKAWFARSLPGKESRQIDALLAPLDLAAFLTDKGDVDTDKVIQYCAEIAPQPADGQKPGGWPDMGQGKRPGQTPKDRSISAGADAWEQRHGKKR